jgi:hypothetical protein
VLHADRPIAGRAEDLLDRTHFASMIAREVLKAPVERGFVVSVMGEWGSGKSSVLNLVEEEIASSATVLWFNPWLFSSSEELVARFFIEVVAQLEGRRNAALSGIAKRLASYGQAVAPMAQMVLPGAGTLIGAVAGVADAAGRQHRSTREEYQSLASELRDLDRRLVVFVDDIDRLRRDEIREVVRLVKLIGDLPNVVYVLAYDRPRVELALGEGDQSEGRSYLEKIVQVPHTVPRVRNATILQLALEELDEVIGDTTMVAFDESAWRELVRVGIGPMIGTLRDARRYANVAPLMLELVGTEVAGQDVLALEALRVFEPDVHAALPRISHVLAGQGGDLRDRQAIDDERRELVEHALSSATHREAARELLTRLFPAVEHLFGGARYQPAQRSWRLARRVASPDVFDTYLHARFGDEGLATAEVERVVELLHDATRLRSVLAEIPNERLDTLLDRLRDYRERFKARDAAGALPLLELMSRLHLGPRFKLFPPEWAVSGVVRDLMRALPSERRATLAEQLFEGAPSLTARWYVLVWFTEGSEARDEDTRPLTPDEAAPLEEELRLQVAQAAAESLSREPRLLTLFSLLVRSDDDEEGRRIAQQRLDDDALMLALLSNSIQYEGWQGAISRLVGPDVLERRASELASHLDDPGLPASTREALEVLLRRDMDPHDG